MTTEKSKEEPKFGEPIHDLEKMEYPIDSKSYRRTVIKPKDQPKNPFDIQEELP